MTKAPPQFDMRRKLPARRKYGNTPVEIDGIRFASKAEGRRYSELRLLEKAGEIRGLQLQPQFQMIIEGIEICKYKADFAYWRGEERIVEDVKGAIPRDFRIISKLFRVLFPGQKLEIVQ